MLGSTKDALKLYKQLDPIIKNFYFMIDLSHIPLQHETIDDVKALANKVGHVHIRNCILKPDDSRFGGNQMKALLCDCEREDKM